MKRKSKYRRDAPADGLARHFKAGTADGLGDSHEPLCSRKRSVGAVLMCGSVASRCGTYVWKCSWSVSFLCFYRLTNRGNHGYFCSYRLATAVSAVEVWDDATRIFIPNLGLITEQILFYISGWAEVGVEF